MNRISKIIEAMRDYGYTDYVGDTTATQYMATGRDSEFGVRAGVLLKELDKVEKEIRLDQTKKVFEALSEVLNEGSCSYRALIYDKLGFEPENYEDLIAGMNITNAIVLLEDYKENNGISALIDQFFEEAVNDKGNL